IIQRIVGAIRESEHATVFEDLEHSKRLTRRLKVLSLVTVLLAVLSSAAAVGVWVSRLDALRSQLQAQNALARVFAERAWGALARGNRDLAVRYAVSGWRASRRPMPVIIVLHLRKR